MWAVQRHSPKFEPSETEKSDPKTDEGIEMYRQRDLPRCECLESTTTTAHRAKDLEPVGKRAGR